MAAAPARPVVKIDGGSVRGVIEKHEDGFDYYAFRGIPYAEPPIGEFRFEDPVPKKAWDGVLECSRYREKCLQYDFINKLSSHNEDCLHLNVFTRSIDIDPVDGSPVIVVVHNGAYTLGSSDDLFYGPDYLIRKNIVLVTFNYRLGVLGFLNLEDEIAPGNQGLKDQAMALQWVRQNIRKFGGEPSNVTVFGASSGGTAAHSLALSSLARGLFHKVIVQGSTLFTPWVSIENPKSKAIMLCELLGKPRLTEPKRMLEFLKTIDAKRLQEAQEQLRLSLDDSAFAPALGDESSPESFTPVDWTTRIENHGGGPSGTRSAVHLPCLVGCNSHEALIYLMDDVIAPGIGRQDYFQMCARDFRRSFNFHGEDVIRLHDLSVEQVQRFYMKDEPLGEISVDKFVDMMNDIYFFEGIHRFARVQATNSSAPTYLYRFSYDGPNALMKNMLKDLPNGACHFDDLSFIFKMRLFEQVGLEHHKRGSVEYRIMEQITEMWANFATYGRPTVEKNDLIPVHWLPITNGTLLRYLDIDEDITMQLTPNVDRKFLSVRDIKVRAEKNHGCDIQVNRI